jgi:hypothetical protein
MQPVFALLTALIMHALSQAKPSVQQAAAGWRPAGPAAAKKAIPRQAANTCSTDIFQQQQQQQPVANEQRAGSPCGASRSSRGLQAAAAAVGARAKQQVCTHDHLVRQELVLQAWQLTHAIIDDWVTAGVSLL